MRVGYAMLETNTSKVITMTVYAKIDRNPYSVPIRVKRDTKDELLKDFPDAYDIKET